MNIFIFDFSLLCENKRLILENINFFKFSLLIDEINLYDQKTKEQEQSLREGDTDSTVNKTRIKDYKKTSLLKAVTLFEEFLRILEKSERKKMQNGKIYI